MDAAAVLLKLNLRIGDTNNFTFTSDEKTEAVEESFRDPYVSEYAWIETETFSNTVFRQALPATISSVDNILYRSFSSEFPEPLPAGIWDVRSGFIRWSHTARHVLTNGSTVYLEGRLNLATTATITEPTVQEYAINLSIYNTLKIIGSQKTNRFTKNDVSVGELIAMRNQAEREVLKYQQKVSDRGYVTS